MPASRPILKRPLGIYRLARSSEEDNSPLVIFSVKKDEFGNPKEVKKVLLDPEQGMIIDKNEYGDISVPNFPTVRKKREADKEEKGETDDDEKDDVDDADPNGHSHTGAEQMDFTDFAGKKVKKKKT